MAEGGAIAGAGIGEGYKIAGKGVGRGGHCAFCLRLASFQSRGEEMWATL